MRKNVDELYVSSCFYIVPASLYLKCSPNTTELKTAGPIVKLCAIQTWSHRSMIISFTYFFVCSMAAVNRPFLSPRQPLFQGKSCFFVCLSVCLLATCAHPNTKLSRTHLVFSRVDIVDIEQICPPMFITFFICLIFKPNWTLAEKSQELSIKQQNEHVRWCQPVKELCWNRGEGHLFFCVLILEETL